jgi:hypothetical protein
MHHRYLYHEIKREGSKVRSKCCLLEWLPLVWLDRKQLQAPLGPRRSGVQGCQGSLVYLPGNNLKKQEAKEINQHATAVDIFALHKEIVKK